MGLKPVPLANMSDFSPMHAAFDPQKDSVVATTEKIKSIEKAQLIREVKVQESLSCQREIKYLEFIDRHSVKLTLIAMVAGAILGALLVTGIALYLGLTAGFAAPLATVVVTLAVYGTILSVGGGFCGLCVSRALFPETKNNLKHKREELQKIEDAIAKCDRYLQQQSQPSSSFVNKE